MKIYTITPNPALDLSGNVERLVPNEKNYVFRERRDPGGNGINAARIAHRLGAQTLALGFLGGCAGEEIRALLKKEGVATLFTPIRQHTRINVTVSNHATHQQTRLTFPGPNVSATEQRSLIRTLRGLRGPGILLLGGSMPPGCGPDFHRKLAQAARGLGTFVDVPGRFIESVTMGYRPLLLKPNVAELEAWSGRKLSSHAAVLKAAHALSRKAALVCVSLAEKGALLISAPQDAVWIGESPRIKAKGTVGAGDSMVGAMAAYLAKNGITHPEILERPDPKIRLRLGEMLRWGLAAGAATSEATGTAQAEASEIRRLYARAKVKLL